MIVLAVVLTGVVAAGSLTGAFSGGSPVPLGTVKIQCPGQRRRRPRLFWRWRLHSGVVTGDVCWCLSRNGFVSPMGALDNPQIFIPWQFKGSNPRAQDSELNLLNYLANLLGPATSYSGRIVLYSERPRVRLVQLRDQPVQVRIPQPDRRDRSPVPVTEQKHDHAQHSRVQEDTCANG
jgi:hypothetical protein